MDGYLALGYDCNHRCEICPIRTRDRFEKKYTIDDIHRIIDKFACEPGSKITVSGGEPTVSPFFMDVIEYLTRKESIILLLSNSELFANLEFLRTFARTANPDNTYIHTAIHHADHEIHDMVTGCNGSYERSLCGLSNLVSAGFHVTVKHIISRVNYRELSEFVDFVHNRFSPQVSLGFYSMDYVGSAQKNADKYFVSYEELRPYLEACLDRLENNYRSDRREVWISEFPLCAIDPYYWRYFVPASRVEEEFYAAPIVDNVEKVLYNNTDRRTNYEECTDCAVRKYCSGCWSSAYRQSNGKKMLYTIKAEQNS